MVPRDSDLGHVVVFDPFLFSCNSNQFCDRHSEQRRKKLYLYHTVELFRRTIHHHHQQQKKENNGTTLSKDHEKSFIRDTNDLAEEDALLIDVHTSTFLFINQWKRRHLKG